MPGVLITYLSVTYRPGVLIAYLSVTYRLGALIAYLSVKAWSANRLLVHHL